MPEPFIRSLTLLPPAADKCQECAVEHKPEEMHDLQSLYYRTKFQMDHGRAATWDDAIAHCDEKSKEYFKLKLRFLKLTAEQNIEELTDSECDRLVELEREIYGGDF